MSLWKHMCWSCDVVKLVLNVTYPPEYPDVYPEVSLEPSEESLAGELTSEEESKLLKSLEEAVSSVYQP